MKTTDTKKQAAKGVRTRRGTGPVQGAPRRDARNSTRAAAERQVAEIERTFTLRYEW
jgi:hypothetical protein